MPSAPTSLLTSSSENTVRRAGDRPALAAAANSWASIVPASQWTCRQPRSAYFQPVLPGTPVTTIVVTSP